MAELTLVGVKHVLSDVFPEKDWAWAKTTLELKCPEPDAHLSVEASLLVKVGDDPTHHEWRRRARAETASILREAARLLEAEYPDD